MGTKKLGFHINPVILKDLKAFQKALPNYATRENVKGGAPAYDHPAGMALLGMKDEEVDTIIPLKMSGGCWDAPNINFTDMDKGFRELIDKDRICAGMALVRHPTWNRGEDYDGGAAKMPTHLKYQLHSMRNGFADITKTAWIILQKDYFRVYRPTLCSSGKIGAREVSVTGLFDEKSQENAMVSKHIEAMKGMKERKEEQKRERARQEAIWKKQQLERIEKERISAEKYKQQQQKKIEVTNAKLKEAKEDIVDAGGGFVFMKGKDGKYVLWQTGRKT